MEPLLKKRLLRFCKHRRGFFSFCIILVTFLFSLGSEWIANDKPFILHFEDHTYFPMFKFYPGSLFGEEISLRADYKKLTLSERFKKNGNNWAVFPPVPFAENESISNLPSPPPSHPTRQNLLGTDDRGRDLLTRLLYGYRNSMLFALISWLGISVIAYTVGAIQGYLGGRIDFLGQRLTEIWNALPILYVIIFLMSLFRSGVLLLTLIWVAFGWMSLASYVRAEVLRIRNMEFVTAAKALGAKTPRVLFRHILPNTLTPLITLSPFIISASIGSLAALDYLGLGLPPPRASWGELLRQGKENLMSWWLAFFPFASLFGTLLLLNFIGEGIRNAFDTRQI